MFILFFFHPLINFPTNENITKCSLSIRFVQACKRISQNVPLYTNDAAKTLTASVLRRQLNETGSARQSLQHVNHFNTHRLSFLPLSLRLQSCCCAYITKMKHISIKCSFLIQTLVIFYAFVSLLTVCMHVFVCVLAYVCKLAFFFI